MSDVSTRADCCCGAHWTPHRNPCRDCPRHGEDQAPPEHRTPVSPLYDAYATMKAERDRLCAREQELLERNTALVEEHRRLTAENRQRAHSIDEWLKERKRLTADLAACREALSFYSTAIAQEWLIDSGHRARAALARLEGE